MQHKGGNTWTPQKVHGPNELYWADVEQIDESFILLQVMLDLFPLDDVLVATSVK
jgi:hypothetical protein